MSAVSERVARPVEEVFDYIVEPGLLSSYFTSEASGPLVVGADVTWSFRDGHHETVHVDAVETNRLVVFRRGAARVSIALEPLDANDTKVTITDESEPPGWQDMLDALKARMELGIDLRA